MLVVSETEGMIVCPIDSSALCSVQHAASPLDLRNPHTDASVRCRPVVGGLALFFGVFVPSGGFLL